MTVLDIASVAVFKDCVGVVLVALEMGHESGIVSGTVSSGSTSIVAH